MSTATTTKKTFAELAMLLQAHENCQVNGNTEWMHKHQEKIDAIRDSAPSGSGFDRGTKIMQRDGHDYGKSIIFETAFHHMDEHGYYDGWTEHRVLVKAHLVFGYTVQVSGADRNQIKDYIADTFHHWLDSECDV